MTFPARVVSQDERCKLYGDPGVRAAAVDEDWRRENIVEFHGETALPGIPPHWYFATHRLVVPHLRRALERAARESSYAIERAASFVFRHQRHELVRPLSMHSWGLAVDVDAARNGARRGSVLSLAPRPWSPAWKRRWPGGLPEDFVTAWEAEGWTWGGRWRRYCDPMHFEWGRAP